MGGLATRRSVPRTWGAAREVPPLRAGVIVPMRPGNGQWDQQGLRAAGALPRKRRGAGGFVCDINAHGPVERRLAERTESGCAMTALRPPRCGACRAVLDSPRPAPGQRAVAFVGVRVRRLGARRAAIDPQRDTRALRCRERSCRRPLIEGVPREEGCCCRGRGWRVVGRVRWHGAGRAEAGRLGRVRPREGVEVGGAGRRQRSPSHAPHVTWSARSRARHTAPSRST